MTKREAMSAPRGRVRVIKIGGSELDRPGFLTALADLLAAERHGPSGDGVPPAPTVIVHGGGKGIDALSARLGIVPERVAGLRKTDAATLAAVVMALCGAANTELVAALVAAGVKAVGLTGVDDRLLACRRLAAPDLGYVGEVTRVNASLLWALLDAGYLPVVASLGLAEEGEAWRDESGAPARAQLFNVNADQAAAAIGAALGAASVDFVTDVPGVIDGGRVRPALTAGEVERLIAGGVIHGGMRPKVGAALSALARGVAAARIVNLEGLTSGGGTVVMADGGGAAANSTPATPSGPVSSLAKATAGGAPSRRPAEKAPRGEDDRHDE